MGVFQTLGLLPKAGMMAPRSIASPWTESQLQTIVWSDVMGDEVTLPLSRAEAMQVPAVARARTLICSTIARYPLIALDRNGPLSPEKQPTWMYSTAGALSPQLRCVWTLDDLFFYGASLWWVTRGSDGQILTADRIPWESWAIDAAGAIHVNGVPVNARDVIYFPSHVEGILEAGRTAIRSASKIMRSVERRASNPVPVMEIHELESDDLLTSVEAKQVVTDYNKARRDPEGATVFTPTNIELKPHGDKADAGALVEARNASRLDIANLAGVPASMLEGSSAGASLTYVTTEGKRSELVEYGVQPYADTFTARLSMDDVVPRGQRTRLDQAEQLAPLPSATGPETQD